MRKDERIKTLTKPYGIILVIWGLREYMNRSLEILAPSHIMSKITCS